MILITAPICAQEFNEFASAVYINNCVSPVYYNTSGSGVNCINTNCSVLFHGSDFGSFDQNSGQLELLGGEIKTFKKNNVPANVCGANLNYVVYQLGNRPASPVFTTIPLPFAANCNTVTNTFDDGFGPCDLDATSTDQKWNQLSAGIDLTNRPIGNYTLEVYYDYTGDYNSTSDCDDVRYINNNSNPTNFTANFEIVASGSDCAVILDNPLSQVSYECNNDWIYLAFLYNYLGSSKNKIIVDQLGSSDERNIIWISSTISEHIGEIQLELHTDDLVTNAPIRIIEENENGEEEVLKIISLNCNSFISNAYMTYDYSGQAFLHIENWSKNKPITIKTFDLNGKLIKTSIISDVDDYINLSIKDKKLSTSLYFINVSNGSQTVKLKYFNTPD